MLLSCLKGISSKETTTPRVPDPSSKSQKVIFTLDSSDDDNSTSKKTNTCAQKFFTPFINAKSFLVRNAKSFTTSAVRGAIRVGEVAFEFFFPCFTTNKKKAETRSPAPSLKTPDTRKHTSPTPTAARQSQSTTSHKTNEKRSKPPMTPPSSIPTRHTTDPAPTPSSDFLPPPSASSPPPLPSQSLHTPTFRNWHQGEVVTPTSTFTPGWTERDASVFDALQFGFTPEQLDNYRNNPFSLPKQPAQPPIYNNKR